MKRTYRLLAAVLSASAVVAVLAVAGAQGAAPGAPGAPGSPAVAAVSPTGASGATGVTSAPDLTATLSACHVDAVPANRYAIFASQTLAQDVRGTLEMAVRFKLEERSASDAAFLPVKATGFGVWVTSQARVGIFTYSHEVTALPAPAAFRVLVRARWIGQHRRVLRESYAVSPICVQTVLEPDLVVGRITRAPGAAAGTVQYAVEVRNIGTAAAGPFQVSLTVGATALAPVTISGLPAGAAQPAVFTGPPCTAAGTLTAVADPGNTIVEASDSRRTLTVGCPIP